MPILRYYSRGHWVSNSFFLPVELIRGPFFSNLFVFKLRISLRNSCIQMDTIVSLYFLTKINVYYCICWLFWKQIYIYDMENECKKCNVVHNSLAERCFSCGASLKSIKVSRANLRLPTLLATTFLSLSVVILNVNSVFGG